MQGLGARIKQSVDKVVSSKAWWLLEFTATIRQLSVVAASFQCILLRLPLLFQADTAFADLSREHQEFVRRKRERGRTLDSRLLLRRISPPACH